MTRADGRAPNEMRPVEIELDYQRYAEGSALIKSGNTWVLCSASVEERVPSFLAGEGKGWVTAEYAMLPRATHTRSGRKPGGRGKEIQRLIGRSLRAVVDMKALGERTITIDCDVLQADGGTRVASITGGYVALACAIDKLKASGLLSASAKPLRDSLAAISVGIIDGEPRLDLAYEEDSRAQVDMNIVMTGTGKIVELQGTAESEPFDHDQLNAMLELGRLGTQQLRGIQQTTLSSR